MKLRHNAGAYEVKVQPGPRPQVKTNQQPAKPFTGKPTQHFLKGEQNSDNGNSATIERPRLKFKHFKPRVGQAPVEKLPQPTAQKSTRSPQVQSERAQRQMQARSDLDVGFQHFLRGNAPTVLGQSASQLVQQPKAQKNDYKHNLTERFSSELEESLGLSKAKNGSTSSKVQKQFQRRENGIGFGFHPSAEQTFSNNALNPTLEQSMAESPSFVPKHGVSLYHSSGCNCVASFMGFAE